MVAVAPGVKLAAGEDVKVGTVMSVGREVLVLDGKVVMDGTILVGAGKVPVSPDAWAGSSKAQPANITKPNNHAK